MIIELKTGRRNDELCEKGLALMRAYNGPYCIESFDPRIVRWFRKNAKDVLRGQLSDAPASFRDEPKPLAFALGCLFTNVLARPQLSLMAPAKSHGPPVWRRQWAPSAYAGPCAPKTI